MLILTRKVGETIFIGEDIRIVLVEMQGDQARIGISCPDCLTIMRSELDKRTKKSKWPNCSPDEIAYLQHRLFELREWWTLDQIKERRKEMHALEEFITELQRWALLEYVERYSHWYKEA